MNYKRAEIKDYAIEQIKEKLKFDEGYLNNDTHDIHHDLFNSSYYIIGTYEAGQWLGSEALNIIGFIKEYEEEQFGESNTDFTNAESVVNMYTYIIGEEILYESDFQDEIIMDSIGGKRFDFKVAY